MKLCQITLNDPVIKVVYRHDFCELINSQMVMKLVRIIMIKVLLNVCTCLHSNGLDIYQNIYLHVISTNFETRLPRYSLCIFWRGLLNLCYVARMIQSL